MTNQIQDQQNLNHNPKEYILYDIVIKEEAFDFRTLITNLESDLKKYFKSVTADPNDYKILCKLKKNEGNLVLNFIFKHIENK